MPEIDTTKMAGIAMNQMQELSDASVGPDRKTEAEYWAKRAIEDLEETYEIDPEYYYTSRAEQAIISFIKIGLSGQDPAAAQKYRVLADEWAMKAQEKKHREEQDPDTREDKRISFYRK